MYQELNGKCNIYKQILIISECIDKNLLIKTIEEIKNSFKSRSKEDEIIFDEIRMLPPTTPNNKTLDFMDNFTDFNLMQLCQLPNGIILNKFITILDKEIRKIYLFYNNIERELYILINTRLHFRKNYEYKYT